MELPAEIDVAILGGGFAGCATARELASRGVRAIVLEREAELGRHASGRGAGLGRQLAEDDDTTALTVRGAALLRTRFAEAWSPTGGILTFDDEAHAAAYVARARRFDLGHEVLDRDRVLARWPALTGLPIAAALHVLSDGMIDVRALLGLFARDRTVFTSTTVTAVREGLVETSRGAVRARVIVDATGAWAGGMTGDPPLASFKRHLFLVEGLPIASSTPFLWHVGACEIYLRPAGDAVLVSPCDATPTPPIDQVADTSASSQLVDQLASAAPAMSIDVKRAWACQRAFTSDRRFRLGVDPSRPWLVWAAGLGGHGATASAAVGEVVADAVAAAVTRR